MQGSPDASTPAARVVRWGGAVLFAASLAFFLVSYGVTFARVPASSAGAARAIAADVLLFTLFALHHSVFARRAVREQVARRVPAGLERSLYVWIASALFILVCAWWQPVPGVVWHVDGIVRWPLVALQAFALVLILRSAAMIDVFELAGLRTSPHAATGGFKRAGPYAWMRHPIYAGWFLLVFCAPFMTMTRFVFAVVSGAYVLAAIPLEERSLRASSAGAYDEYRRAVRWRLIPGLY